jgi:hypothetical protein
MNCAEFTSWLDSGSPDAGSSRALAHAERCLACAGALRAVQSLESALRASPRALPDAPDDFVEHVMARVEAAVPVPKREERRLPFRDRWWVELASDPVGAVSLTLALAIGLAAARFPFETTAVAAALVTLPLRWIGSAAVSEPAQAITRALDGGLDPIARLGLEIVAGSCALWAAYAVYRRIERVIVLLGRGRSV